MGTYTWFHHTTEELSEFQSYVPYQEGYCHHIPRYAAACGPSSEMETRSRGIRLFKMTPKVISRQYYNEGCIISISKSVYL